MAQNPHHAILIAMGQAKPGGGGLPPSTRGKFGGAAPSGSPASPAPDDPAAQPMGGMGGGMGKKSAEEAGVLTDEQKCGGCKHFTKESGECAVVDGQYGPCWGCKLYEAANAGDGEGAEMDIGIGGAPAGGTSVGVRPT